MPRQRSRLTWLEPTSSGGLSPMQLLVLWLHRHYNTYSNASSKVEMLTELCQGMKDAGYAGCTIHAVRSKIDSLRREARRERVGDRRHSQAFEKYQESLVAIFANEDQHEDISAIETSEGRNTPSKESIIQSGSRNAPIIVAGENDDHEDSEEIHTGTVMLASNYTLEVAEIRRRFELVRARYDLQQRGVPMETINRMLPLPEE